uniref:serine C-palmitoyltransferase n=1 Tax=Meloidogyne javanica TaxID=6303 RepID=A0A915MT68_MELJA
DQGISSCASIRELGQPLAHTELENLVAEFIGVESAICAMGKTGRGIVEYYNCDSKDVDIFMGTFTKSFGAAGAMSSIMGKDGTGEGQKRIEQLAKNTNYVRLKLKQLGFIVYGSNHSPVIPIMIYHPTKCGLWGRLMLERKIGVVVVSFPATEMTQSRVRI